MDKLNEKKKGSRYTKGEDMWNVQGKDYNEIVNKISEIIDVVISIDAANVPDAIEELQSIQPLESIAASATGNNAGNASQITKFYTYLVSGITGTGVMLPVAADGETYIISAAWFIGDISVYPQSGEGLNVEGVAYVSPAFVLKHGETLIVTKFGAGTWGGALLRDRSLGELIANKVTSISGASTNVQYPSAKLLYDQLLLKQTSLKTYRARITNAGGVADFPVAEATMQNTIGTVTWSRVSAGKYALTSSGLFTVDKTFISPSNGVYANSGAVNAQYVVTHVDVNTIHLVASTSAAGVETDTAFTLYLEIVVYP